MPTCYLSLKKIIVGRSFTPYAEIFSTLIASACLKGIQRESVGRLLGLVSVHGRRCRH